MFRNYFTNRIIFTTLILEIRILPKSIGYKRSFITARLLKFGDVDTEKYIDIDVDPFMSIHIYRYVYRCVIVHTYMWKKLDKRRCNCGCTEVVA